MNEPTTVSVTDYARTVLTARKVEGLRDHEGDAGRCRVYLEGTPLGAMALAEVRRKHVRDWLTATLARHAIVGGKASERLVAASTAQNALNIVPLLQQPLDVLRALPKPSDASAIIFPSVRGGAQSKSGYRRAWHIAFAEAKIAKRPGLGWHVTRHTAATGLLGGWFTGAPAAIKDVQAVLGHSTVIMTEKYAKILDEDLLTRVGARNDNAVEPPPDTERELPAAPDTQRDLDECGEEAAAE